AGQVQVADVLGPRLPDSALVEQVAHVAQEDLELFEGFDDLGLRVGRQVRRDAAGPDVCAVHPEPGDRLEQREDDLATLEADEHRRHRAQLHTAGRQGDQVRGDPVEFHHHHANDVDAFGDLV